VVVLRGLVVFMAHPTSEQTPRPDVSFETPASIGPYRVLRAVARGGMATVYEVCAPHNHERRALKILHATSGIARLRFYREYEALCRLNHPNIVRAYVFGEWKGRPWYTMEFLTGKAVQEHVKSIGVPGTPARTQATLEIGHNLMSALTQLQKWGIVHRDLKSANLVVLSNGQAKLVDFGTAAMENPVAHIPEKGTFIGTTTYASPEQFLGRAVDHRSDLYSAGVLLYRLATGKLPFTETAPEDLARMHVQETPTPPKAFVRGLPSALSDLIMGLLEKQPASRPQNAEQVGRLLTRFLRNSTSSPVDLLKQPTRAIGQEVTLFAIQDFLRQPTSGRKPGAPSTLLLFGIPGSGRRALLRTAILQTPDDPSPLHLPFSSKETAQETLISALEQHPASQLEGDFDTNDDPINGILSLARAHKAQHHDALTVTAYQPSDAGQDALVWVRGLIESAAHDPSLLRILIAAEPSNASHFTHAAALSVHTKPLSIRGVRRLAANLTHRRPPPEALAVWLHERTGGLPGHLRSLVHAVHQQTPRTPGGSWRWKGVESASKVQNVLSCARETADLKQLNPTQRATIATVATVGGTLELNGLRSVLGLSNNDLAATLRDLKEGRWLDWSRDQRGEAVVRLSPHRVPQLLCAALGEGPRAKLHQRLVRSLPVGTASEHSLTWLLRHAPERVRTSDALLWAAPLKRAHRPRDLVRGLEPFMTAHDDLRMDEDGQRLLLIYVQALLVARPADPQLGIWFRKLDSNVEQSSASYQLSLSLLKARLQQMIGHVTNTRRHLGDAWKFHEDNPSPRIAARVATARAWHANQEGKANQAAKWHGRARRLAREAQCSTSIAHAELGVAAWQLSRGHLLETERTCAGLLESSGQLNDPGLHGRTLSIWANSLRQQGKISQALRRLWGEMLSLERAQTPTGHIHGLLATAWCELELGRLGSAQEHLDDIAASLNRDAHLILRVEAGLLQGRLLTASGNAEDAVTSIAAVQRRAERGALTIYSAVAKAYQAEALWMIEKPEAAKQLFDSALQTLVPIGDLPRIAQVCRARARVMAGEIEAHELFAPIRTWLEEQPVLLVRLSEAVAFGEYHAHRGLLTDGSDWVEAAACLHDLDDRLASEEQAALRIHPWSRVSRAFG